MSMKSVITKQQCDICRDELIKLLSKKSTSYLFQKPIDLMLAPYKMTLSNGSKQFNTELKALKQYFKLSDSEINELIGIKMVYDSNGDWSPINKLNTNYYDLAVLVTDIFQRKHCLCVIYNEIKNNNMSSLHNLIKVMNERPNDIYNVFLKGKYDKYVVHNRRNTILGNESEDYTIDMMTNLGYDLVYQASEGSPIDTKLGVDLIFEKDGDVFRVQVKTVGSITKVDETPCQVSVDYPENKKGGFKVYKRNPIYVKTNNVDLLVFVSGKNFLCIKKYIPFTETSQNPLKCNFSPRTEFPANDEYIDRASVIHQYME